MRSFLTVSLILVMTVGCASNPPAFKTRMSKSPTPKKFSLRAPQKNRPTKLNTFAKRQHEKFSSRTSRSPVQKILHPTVTHEKDGSLMVLVHSGAQHVSKLNLPRGIIRSDTRTGAPTFRPRVFPAFYMDRLETTVAQYKIFDSQYNEKSFTDGKECPDCPAMGIDWMSAHRYCLWAGKRLPTEAQWMASAGGNAGNPWPWGQEFLPEKANQIGRAHV